MLVVLHAIPAAQADTIADDVGVTISASMATSPLPAPAPAPASPQTGASPPLASSHVDTATLGQQLRALQAPVFDTPAWPNDIMASAPHDASSAAGAAQNIAPSDKVDFSGAGKRALRWRIEPLPRGMPGAVSTFPDASSPSYTHRCSDYAEGSRIENINRMAAGGEPYIACKPH